MAQSVQVLPDPALPWAIEWEGVALIAMREGLRLTAYQCQAGVWTYGWGETVGVRQGMACSKEEADKRLCAEIAHYAEGVHSMCTRAPNANELAALVSLAYNIGLRSDSRKAGLYYTSVLRLHNAGDSEGAARAFALLNSFRDPATGKMTVSSGLTLRRKQESALYLTPVPDSVGALSNDMPQEVAPESPMSRSPINIASAGTAAATSVSLLSSFGDQADKANTAVGQISTATHGVKGLLADFDLTIPEVGLAIALVGSVVAWRYRLLQRALGWV